MSDTVQTLTVRRAQPGDLDGIMAIEEAGFALPWPRTAVAQDLAGEGNACYWVVTLDDAVVAYLGSWHLDLDFHIGSVATDPQYRRRGLGKLLMLCALRYAAETGAETAFLEHRRSNLAASRLYSQLGFHKLRVRRGYYTDNNEDAIELAFDGLQQDTTRLRLNQEIDMWLRDHHYDLRFTDIECP
jgi:ribosomal-protein-alanine N-acetyltransferase